MKKYNIYSINLELTNKCPLHCPQCYCSLEGDKHMDLALAKEKAKEAADHGAQAINLSGGETLCYPWLYELISYSAGLGLQVNIAISGCYFDQAVLDKLIASGVGSISVSLNGSTKEINDLTRDGYAPAMKAIELVGKAGLKRTYINWVMHANNCADFPNVVAIAEKFGISAIDVIMFKPDSRHELKSFPSGQQLKQTADYIHNYRGPVNLLVETCFSPLLALVSNYSWMGNFNTGPRKGCGAGLYMYNVTVDGLYSPCRHLDVCESFPSLEEYLEKSDCVRQLKTYEEDLRQPCSDCSLERYCRPCPAVTAKLFGSLHKGHTCCEVWQLNESPAPKR